MKRPRRPVHAPFWRGSFPAACFAEGRKADAGTRRGGRRSSWQADFVSRSSAMPVIQQPADSRAATFAGMSGAHPQLAPFHAPPPELQLIYDTAPVGLAFLSPDCRYVQINRRLTEISGILVFVHIRISSHDTLPQD